MTTYVNPARDLGRVPVAESAEPRAFHRSLPGYAPTPVCDLPDLAADLGIDAVMVKDESDRLGLPAFKVLGASGRSSEHFGSETRRSHPRRGQRRQPRPGRGARRGKPGTCSCCVFLPSRSARARREAIEGEGAEVVVIDGTYEEAVAAATSAAEAAGVVEIADVGTSPQARWVIDGYATLFSEAAEQASFDLLIVPVGVGSLAAAATRFAAPLGIPVIGVEPVTAACLTASLEAETPVSVPTPGSSMAGLDCAEISVTAWPSLRAGIAGMVTVSDGEVHDEMRRLAARQLAFGDCGAAAVTALRLPPPIPKLRSCARRSAFGSSTRALLVATEGPTDPDAYRRGHSRRNR